VSDDYDESLDDGGVDEAEEQGVVIPLGKSNMIAWVSEEDREILDFDWKLKTARGGAFPTYYAFRTEKFGRARIEYYLHNVVWERMIGARLPVGFLVDHINQDKLDNRRCNLRLATRNDNERNKGKRRTQAGGTPSSKYKGVNKTRAKAKPWRAIITVEKVQTPLGTFVTEREAAEAYNRAAIYLFGDFACPNKFDDDEEEA
jgi:hypothetical protein